eukprot:541064-Alexandrium_andersonii.AAC.1
MKELLRLSVEDSRPAADLWLQAQHLLEERAVEAQFWWCPSHTLDGKVEDCKVRERLERAARQALYAPFWREGNAIADAIAGEAAERADWAPSALAKVGELRAW